MKNIWQGILISFSMYSVIRVPIVEWNKENMKYAVCFFPLVGVCIGFLLFLLFSVSHWLQIDVGLFAVLAVALPILISGGIHFDGFIDTTDAMASHQPMDRKLEILKDSHVGAFAIINSVLYFLIAYGFWRQAFVSLGQLDSVRVLICFCLIPVLSRALCGFTLVVVECAKTSGLLYMFAQSSDKVIVRNVCLLIFLGSLGMVFWLNYQFGGIYLIAAIIYFYVFQTFAHKNFGGLTGDLAGYFLQIFELLFLILSVLLLIL